MERKYSIGLFALALIVLVGISGAYQLSYEKVKEQAKEEMMEAEHEVKDTPAVPAKGEALKEDCYYLMEVNGYVAVYLSDKETVYDYTSILVSDLPSTLQNEVKNGKYIEDTETLYGFLENYTS